MSDTERRPDSVIKLEIAKLHKLSSRGATLTDEDFQFVFGAEQALAWALGEDFNEAFQVQPEKKDSMTASAKPLRERQDELIEEIMDILCPDLDGERTMTLTQYRKLQAAIAQYTLKVKEGQ